EPEERTALEDDVSPVGAKDAGHEVEQGRLAGAVRADHADDLAPVDVEIELGDDAEAAERLVDGAQLEERLAHQTTSTRVVPNRPSGRPAIRTIRIAPSSNGLVVPDSSTRRFSQTNAPSHSVGTSSAHRRQPSSSVSASASATRTTNA